MSHETIIRAWKDESFRNSLSADERALLPENPAGLIELDDAQLQVAAGAMMPRGLSEGYTCTIDTRICCCDSVYVCASKGYTFCYC
jgi:mersacidin/lichenicidin family type 2 lantibiotic